MKVAAELNKAISFPRILAILKLLVVSVELTKGLNFVFEVVVLNGSQTHTLSLRELYLRGSFSGAPIVLFVLSKPFNRSLCLNDTSLEAHSEDLSEAFIFCRLRLFGSTNLATVVNFAVIELHHFTYLVWAC